MSNHCFDDDIKTGDPCAQKGQGCLDPVTVHGIRVLTDLGDVVALGNEAQIHDYFSDNSTVLGAAFSSGRIADVVNGTLTVTVYRNSNYGGTNYYRFTGAGGWDVVPVHAD